MKQNLTRVTFVFLIVILSLRSAYSQKDISFAKVPILTTEQWRQLEVEEDDQDVLIFDTTTNNFMLFNGSIWVSLGSGGESEKLIREYAVALDLKVEEEAEKNVQTGNSKPVPKIKKKKLKNIILDDSYKNTLIFSGGYKLYDGQFWRDMGDGGKYNDLINKQKTIVGLKDDFQNSWKRKFGVGLFVGQNYTSMFRHSELPSNPFIKELASGWEVGLNQNLIYKKYFQSRFYIGWNNANVTEVFTGDGGKRITSKWNISGPRVSLLPIIFTPGTNDFKLTFGGGFYGKYHLSKSFESDDAETLFTLDDTKLFEYNYEYGVQAQVGIQVYRFFLDINFHNQLTSLIESIKSNNVLEERQLRLKGYSLNLTYTF